MRSTFLSVLLLTLSSAVSGFSVQPQKSVSSTVMFSAPERSAPSPAPSSGPLGRAPSSGPLGRAPSSGPLGRAPSSGPLTRAPFNSAASTVAPDGGNQSKYGKTMELPGTYVRCGRCATSYAIGPTDLGTGKGIRVECPLCSHSWFQTPERLFNLNDGHELIPLPETEVGRITSNVKNGREPDFIGNNKFYVGNLDFGVRENDLRELFSPIGEVGAASIVFGPDGRSRGFAFVTMMDDDVTAKCIELDGKELNGRNINVKPPNN
mmetsp:Transcript_13112/g.19108  ORF Transcript_13112/g.19108 Transcript_13112/m.19108 type:complete len:264 (+) Transcript_13112:62-853(+)